MEGTIIKSQDVDERIEVFELRRNLATYMLKVAEEIKRLEPFLFS